MFDVVTIFCLPAFQSMGPPNSEKRYPSELLRSWLSLNAALLEQVKASCPCVGPYCIAIFLVPYRYEIALSTALICRGERNSDNLVATFAVSGRVSVVTYRRESTFCFHMLTSWGVA